MEPFFIDETFYHAVEDYLMDADLEKEDVEKLPDDHQIKIKYAELQPIFVLKEEWILDTLCQNTDCFAERFPEDSEDTDEDIREAFKKGINLSLINSSMPKLWYPKKGGESFLTKQDLLDAC